MPHSSLDLARVAAAAADSKKATDVVLLDLTAQTDVCDYFLICTGANARLADAIVDEIREKVRRNCGVHPLSTEGREGLRWILLDYGSVVIHVFQPEVRDFYRLERLWGDAPRVPLALGGEDGQSSRPSSAPSPSADGVSDVREETRRSLP